MIQSTNTLKVTTKRNITLLSNLVEWYDFIVFVSLASVTSQVFLPKNTDHFMGLIITFSIFMITYLLRPIGGYILGSMADKYGRLKSFKLSVMLMVFGTLAIALAPSYEVVGSYSILFLIVARMAQAFSIGGEWVISSALVYEASGKHNKFFMTSFINSGIALGVILGMLTIFFLNQFFTVEEIISFWWRAPFFISSILFIFVWLARRKYFISSHQMLKTQKIDFRKHKRFFIALFLFLSFGGIAFYSFTVMSSTIFKGLGFNENYSLIFSIVGVFAMMVFEPVSGALADKYGANKILSIGILGVFFGCLLFKMATLSGDIPLIILSQIIFGIFLAMYMGVSPGFLCSKIDKSERCRVLGVGYNIVLMIFGGTTPLIILYLGKYGAYISTIYLMISCLAALCGIYLMSKWGGKYEA